MKEIILASGSPRRKELLTQIGIPFRVIKSTAAEVITRTDPGEIVEELSLQKARDVAERIAREQKTYGEGADQIILGADTIVVHNSKVLGKPADREEARQMLRDLQNDTHSVFTGVTLLCGNDPGKTESFHCETKVHVHAMSDEEIEAYLDTGDPFDKAGAYGIQGPFAAYVDGIEGDYYNVVGLPVAAVYQALKKLER